MDRLKVRCGPGRPAPISRGARTAETSGRGGISVRVSRLRIESSPMLGVVVLLAVEAERAVSC